MNDQILNEVKERFAIETENRDYTAGACSFVFAGKAFSVHGPIGRGCFAVVVQFPHAVRALDEPLTEVSCVIQPCSPIVGWVEEYRGHYQTTVTQLTFPLIAMNADSLAFAIRELNNAYNRLLTFATAEAEADEILNRDACEAFANDLSDAGELTPPKRLRAALFDWFEDTESETAKRLAFLRVDRSDDADTPF